jgi:HEAT repeat protein
MLRDLLERDPSDLVAAAALRALGATRAPAAWETLASALGDRQASVPRRVAALDGLASLGDARAIPLALEQAAPGRDARLRLQAIAALGRLGRGQGVVAPRLRRLLADEDGSVRGGAARALAEIGDPRSRDALSAALEAEGDPRPRRDLQAALEALQGRR